MANRERARRRIERILCKGSRALRMMMRRASLGLIFLATPISVLTAAVSPTIASESIPSDGEQSPALQSESNVGFASAPSSAASAPALQQFPAPATTPASAARLGKTVPFNRTPGQNPNLRYGDDWLYVGSKAPNNEIIGYKPIWDLESERQMAKARRSQIEGGYIWFEREDKSFIIVNPGVLKSAQELIAPSYPIVRQATKLDKEQKDLAKRREEWHGKDPELQSKLDAQQSDIDARRTVISQELSRDRDRMLKGMQSLLESALASGLAHPE